jgi:hypothetical protein
LTFLPFSFTFVNGFNAAEKSDIVAKKKTTKNRLLEDLEKAAHRAADCYYDGSQNLLIRAMAVVLQLKLKEEFSFCAKKKAQMALFDGVVQPYTKEWFETAIVTALETAKEYGNVEVVTLIGRAQKEHSAMEVSINDTLEIADRMLAAKSTAPSASKKKTPPPSCPR